MKDDEKKEKAKRSRKLDPAKHIQSWEEDGVDDEEVTQFVNVVQSGRTNWNRVKR